jgi:hypothetical protein
MIIRKVILLFCIICYIVFVGCTKKKSNADFNKPVFHIPVIVQESTNDTIETIKAFALRDVWFKYGGKYKFTDTLKLAENPGKDTTFLNDYIMGYSHIQEGDTLNTDGFQVFVDYKTSIHNKHYDYARGNYYFPVYIVNETSKTKLFIAKDSYVFGIQEALDTTYDGGWYAIEYKGVDFCGNGYFGVLVRPGEFILGLIPKYEGNEKQSMKVRLKIGEDVYVSPIYQGTFNREQFRIVKGTEAAEIIKNYKSSTIMHHFYGAIPKGYQ